MATRQSSCDPFWRKPARAAAAGLICLLSACIGVALAGCDDVQQSAYKAAIERALYEDSLTGHEPTYSHTESMRRLDLSACPDDFRVAYVRHIHAWDTVAAVQQAKAKLDSEEDTAALAGLFATLADSAETPWTDHLQAEQKAAYLQRVVNAAVVSTWHDVEDVATRYGARLPVDAERTTASSR